MLSDCDVSAQLQLARPANETLFQTCSHGGLLSCFWRLVLAAWCLVWLGPLLDPPGPGCSNLNDTFVTPHTLGHRQHKTEQIAIDETKVKEFHLRTGCLGPAGWDLKRGKSLARWQAPVGSPSGRGTEVRTDVGGYQLSVRHGMTDMYVCT